MLIYCIFFRIFNRISSIIKVMLKVLNILWLVLVEKCCEILVMVVVNNSIVINIMIFFSFYFDIGCFDIFLFIMFFVCSVRLKMFRFRI